MSTQNLWLKVMLFAVALGAAAGILAVLTGAYDVLNRTMGSCLLVAIASLLMIPMQRQMQKPATQLAGIAGSSVIIVLLALSLLLVWDIPSLMQTITGRYNTDFSYAIFLMIGWVGITGFPTVVFFRMAATEHSRYAGWAGVYLCGIVLLLFLLDTLNLTFRFGRSSWNYDFELTYATFILGLAGLLIIGTFVGQKTLYIGLWRWAGVGSAMVAWLMASYGIWMDTDSDLARNVFAILISFSSFVVYLNIILLCPLQSKYQWMRFTSICVTAIALLMINTAIIQDVWLNHDTFFERMTSAMIILAFGCSLAFALTARLTRSGVAIQTKADHKSLFVTCPLCQTKQTLPTSRLCSCQTCGLGFELKLMEPHCPACGYLLYHLKGSCCPECGQNVRGADGTLNIFKTEIESSL